MLTNISNACQQNSRKVGEGSRAGRRREPRVRNTSCSQASRASQASRQAASLSLVAFSLCFPFNLRLLNPTEIRDYRRLQLSLVCDHLDLELIHQNHHFELR